MIWERLSKPPQDLRNFVSTPVYETVGQTQHNLGVLVKLGLANIKALNFPSQVIKNLEPLLRSHLYDIFTLQEGNLEANADFYLIKFHSVETLHQTGAWFDSDELPPDGSVTNPSSIV